ncbi:MAG: hypothetical protein ACRD1K_09175, partial [Acidimicrobiales bacterium]
MTDDLLPGDLGGPRPVPDSLRVRLEEALTGAPGEVVARGLDGPRPVPPAVRTRLEAALVAGASESLCANAHRRASAPTDSWRTRPTPRRLVAAAAALLLVASAAAVTTVGGDGPSPAEVAAGQTAMATPTPSEPPA